MFELEDLRVVMSEKTAVVNYVSAHRLQQMIIVSNEFVSKS